MLQLAAAVSCLATHPTLAATDSASTSPSAEIATNSPAQAQNWNLHAQNTDIVQGYPGYSARYSGPNSLPPGGQVRESVSVDLMVGRRLWRGAEAHVDGLMWQGFGIGKTLGIESFPNGEAFRLGTDVPNVNFTRVFLRQSFGLGGEQEMLEDGLFQLAGKEAISRLTFTIGRFSAKDIFDNNAYANDPRTQFMSWGLMANEAWDYPADSLGYTTGFAAELSQPKWTARYGFFQVPRVANGVAQDPQYLKAWGMVAEWERRFSIKRHPGTLRLLAFLNQTHAGQFQAALDDPLRPANIQATRAYRLKYGFGLNLEQEIVTNIGVFWRLGWNDGKTESWNFADVDRTASLGVSIKGSDWGRPGDVVGIAGVLNGISKVHQRFFQAGGTGILAGDETLNYGWEQSIEAYYNIELWRTVRLTLDYQFVNHPAFNRDRGPISVIGGRLHWEF